MEAPIGDFFGVMHGKKFYPINTPYLAVSAESGYSCYFKMPFARSARIELEGGEKSKTVYLMVDWHRYPGQELKEARRFAARWRREMPTQSYGEDYLILDADGPGQLLGFVYGVRLIDNEDRWSHGGGDNIYIDGLGQYPAYIRGIGGEDTFGAGFGGALHNPPESYLYQGIPYYVHEDTGEARPAQRLVGYRFYENESIHFEESIHVRFGSMSNDICSTVYWYQEKPVRPFFKMPSFTYLQPHALTGNASMPNSRGMNLTMPLGTNDLELPASGQWWVCGPFFNRSNKAMDTTLAAEIEFFPDQLYDGMHNEDSLWLTAGSVNSGKHQARWLRRNALHGFVDFRHVFRPNAKSVAPTEAGVALARCTLYAERETTVSLRVAWDDELVIRLNEVVYPMGKHTAFRDKTIQVKLKAGANTLLLKLSNELGANHGGWAFCCKVTDESGSVLVAAAEEAPRTNGEEPYND
ncbi:DUF2961 domain-containing protein [Paenibacillus koleovorans]|uniref:DUF2961 domain-containing protein n=1 Tax=Paenibacillus koleovorans TaxID=121608 RepID=UPI001FE73450|nr:DUF2961 domain-containing protein [Paenibacillus koleovorans]